MAPCSLTQGLPLFSPPPPWPTWVAHCSGWSEVVVLFPHPALVVAVTDDDVDLNLNAFMKNNNAHAVAFNLDTGRWQFATPVHRQAVVCVAGPVVRAHAHASCLLCCVFCLFVCLLSLAIQCGSILFTMVHGRWCSYATLCFD